MGCKSKSSNYSVGDVVTVAIDLVDRADYAFFPSEIRGNSEILSLFRLSCGSMASSGIQFGTKLSLPKWGVICGR